MKARFEFVLAPLHPDLQAALFAAWPAASFDAVPRTVVVPTRALGRFLLRERARLGTATCGVRTLTWLELGLELSASERDAEARRFLGSEAQAWLVRQLRETTSRAPTPFDAALDVRGFRAVLQRAFDALSRAGLTSRRDVERFLVHHGFDLPLAARHVLELGLAYRTSFEATHDDAAAVLARAARVPAGRWREVLGTAHLEVYGFDALDAVELQLLGRLTTEPGLDLALYIPYQEGAEPVLARRVRELGALERAVPAAVPYAPETRFVAAPSDESEAEEIVRHLLRAAAGGIRFDAMAVVARNSRRLDLVRSTLGRCGVPYTLQPGASLQGTRSGRALVAFFEVLDAGIRLDPVLAFLALAPVRWHDWAGLETDAVVSAWERAAHAAGVGRGLAEWTAQLERYATDLEAEAARREADSEPAQRARDAARAARELLQVVTVLDAEAGRFPVRARWREWVDATAAWLVRTLAPSVELDAVGSAVGRLQSLEGLGRSLPSRADFRDAVRSVLADATLTRPSDTVPAVWLGTSSALWGASFDVVCIAGLREGEWPAAARDDPVLPDRLRTALANRLADDESLPSRHAAVERERREFVQWCRAARQRLVLTWARLDPATGAPGLPSTLGLEFASALAGRPLDYEGIETWDGTERVALRRTGAETAAEPLDLAELDVWTVAGLPPAAARRYVAGLGSVAARGQALERLRQNTPRFTSVDGWLAGPAARAALEARGAPTSISVSQLVTYATCPFRYFMRYMLRVEPLDRDEPRDLSGQESGKLVHRILEQFHRDLQRAGISLAELTDAELGARFAAAFEAGCREVEARGRTGARLLWAVRKQRLRDDLSRALRFERQRSGRWQPREFEQRFGRGGKGVPSLRLDDGSLVGLHGVIDRVDVDPETGGLCVIDYKTGRALTGRTGDPAAVQLVVYLHVATAGHPEQLAASEARFAYVTRRAQFALQRLPGPVLAARANDLVAFVSGVVGGIARGEFLPQPGPRAQRCEICDYRTTCDARIAVLAERKAGAGQTVRLDALPEFASALEADIPAGSGADSTAGDA